MGKKTFIPNWYIDKKNKIRTKKIKIAIMIVLIANLLLTVLIVNSSNNLKNIDEQLPSVNNSLETAVKQDIFTIEKYKQLSDFFQKNNLNYKSIIITNSSLEVEIEANSYEEYIYMVKCIEKNYSIKKLTEAIKNGDNLNFKVILGV